MKKKLLLLNLFLIFSTHQLAAVNFSIDNDQSKIYAHVKVTGHNFKATVSKYDYDINLSEETGLPESIQFDFDFNDLKTGIKRRDKEMLHWLGHDKFPRLHYEFTKIREIGGMNVMAGNLTFHNHTQAILIPIEITKNGKAVKITGKTTLDYTDFNLEVIKMLFFKVHSLLEIHFELNGTVDEKGGNHE